MKKQKFLLGTAGLFALGLTACSNEMPVQEPQKVAEDESRFIAVTLSAPNAAATRAFENGSLTTGTDGTATAGESYVYCLDFLFYDTNGNPTGTVSHLNEAQVKGLEFTNNATGANVERFCTSVVPVQLTQGDNLPAQVICIVNGNPDVVNEIAKKSLSGDDDAFRDITQAEFSRGGNFLMTNSVYYGQDELTGQANQRLCATPINANTQLFATSDAAKNAVTAANGADATAAQKAALVDIYVERVAAKVSLTLDNANISNYTLANADADGADISIKFVPEYWLMNAVDNKTYLTKRYGVEVDGEIDMHPDYAQINGALTGAGFSNWNSVANHRSYWGTSPSYFKNNFPLVSDQVFDPEANPGVEYDPYAAGYAYDVNYYSYNSVVAGINNETYSEVRKQWKEVGENGFNKSVIYTRETTTPQRTIQNDGTNGNPAAAVGSAVVLGHYEVISDDATETKTFYVDRNDGDNGTYYGSMESARTALLNRQTILFVDEEGNDPVDVEDISAANLACFTVEHPKAAVRAKAGNPNVAGRLVTLQLSSVPSNIYFYDNASGDYIAVNADNLTTVNAMLVSQTGYFDVFFEGLGFFTVPIRHLNFKDASYTANDNGGVYNWKTMSVGELGIVRNHSYDLTISSIKGLANGLRSRNQPIVPAKDSFNQYVAMRLNILSWNVVNSWSVNL